MSINKLEYRRARRLLRANGRYALRWMDAPVREAMEHLLFNIQDTTDPLVERAWIVAYCKRTGVPCSVRHTQAIKH